MWATRPAANPQQKQQASHPHDRHQPLAGVEDDYEGIEALRLRLLQAWATWAKVDIGAGKTVDGESFLDGLKTGKYD
ncbi:hypothetical protein [Pseudomonas borbori]|uniref:hypothetical protein n=1 Tax=Pseudomonas borbori TaxID=289003 RepID=UPI0011321352|nr:hypothetical protein [Pseudomonas borbori]